MHGIVMGRYIFTSGILMGHIYMHKSLESILLHVYTTDITVLYVFMYYYYIGINY